MKHFRSNNALLDIHYKHVLHNEPNSSTSVQGSLIPISLRLQELAPAPPQHQRVKYVSETCQKLVRNVSETCQKCAASEDWWAGVESRKLAQENWDEMRKRLHDFHTSDHDRAKFLRTVPNCGADACRPASRVMRAALSHAGGHNLESWWRTDL